MARYTVENTVAIGKPVRVFCDGVEIHDCVEANDVEGWAVVYERGQDGQISITGDDIDTRKISGVIHIQPLESS